MPAPRGTYTACSITPQTLADLHYLKAKMFDATKLRKASKAKRPPEWARCIPGLIRYLVERELARYKGKSLPF